MVLYAVIMFAVAIPFGILSLQIYRGKTDLIHSYHQEKVTDPAAYGKAFGKALAVFAITMPISGIVSLAGSAAAAVVVLAVGMIVGIAAIVAVQNKYNGGIF